jgi:competence protein ComEA
MLRTVRRASSRAVARVAGSRFAKPAARVVLAAAGLLLLAFIGKAAAAGALGATASLPSPPASAPAPVAEPAPAPAPSPSTAPSPTPSPGPAPRSRTQATADDPVILNTANVDDLRRLPGIGEKRANAIVALRVRLGGRFRAVDDLLKVKGIGRTTLKRLRPLVRLDAPAVPDAGAPP